MGLFDLLLLAIGLSMDSFSVAICKGLSFKKFNWKKAIIIGLWFGGFQALMPAIGFLLSSSFEEKIKNYDHWIAFILLVFIGGNMIKESMEDNKCDEEKCKIEEDPLKFWDMFMLAVATSIDALAVGITFAFLHVDLIPSITLIGCTTFLISVAGVKIGTVFGAKYQSKAELAGGIILILIGAKILIEHLF